MAENTISTLIGNPTYGKTTGGYKNTVPELRKWDKTLMVMLNVGPVGVHKKYLLHKTIEKGLGDTINVRRYFALESDPRKLQLDKNTTTGPALKKLQGLAVEFKLEWWGNGIDYNDTLAAVHLDNLMEIIFPRISKNALEVLDNVAAIAMYSGASKIFVKSYTPATGAVDISATDSTTVAGALNINVIRWVTQKMINNTETYTPSGGAAVTIPATIEPIIGGRYKVLTSANGVDDLLDDTQFIEKFVKGISANELRNNEITNVYRFSIETVNNYLTIKKADGTVQIDRTGELEVAFVLGKDFGADVDMNDQSVRIMQKKPGTVDSGDQYGRKGFVTWKACYNAQVVNSMAIYAIVFKPGNALVTGAAVAPATSNPRTK